MTGPGAGDGDESAGGPGPRFTLYDEAGAFGVYDGQGPQVFFAETRERAAVEVRRANAIVAAYPTTVSMRHLREMDAQWRAARGLPLLPVPAGHRVLVDAPVDARIAVAPPAYAGVPSESGDSGGGVSPLARCLEAAASVRADAEAQAFGRERAAAVLGTRRVLRTLDGATDAAELPMSAFRKALREVYRDRTPAAEAAFASLVRERGAAGAAASLRDEPRGLLPGLERSQARGTLGDCDRLVREAAVAAPFIARAQRAVDSAAEHLTRLGLPDERPALGLVATRGQIVRALATQETRAAEARSTQVSPDNMRAAVTRLREAWNALAPAERDAVRVAIPDVQALLRPARGRDGPNRGRSRSR